MSLNYIQDVYKRQIAHQDDKYNPSYVENLMAYTKNAKKPLIFFGRGYHQ